MAEIDLKKIIETNNLTMTQVALDLNVSMQTLRSWKVGLTTPSEDNLKKLEQYIKDKNLKK